MNFLGNTNDFKKTTIENGKPKDQGFPDETHNIAQGLREIYSKVNALEINQDLITELQEKNQDLIEGIGQLQSDLRNIMDIIHKNKANHMADHLNQLHTMMKGDEATEKMFAAIKNDLHSLEAKESNIYKTLNKIVNWNPESDDYHTLPESDDTKISIEVKQ